MCVPVGLCHNKMSCCGSVVARCACQGHEALDRKMPSESVTTELSIPTLILLPEYAGCQVVNMSRLCVRAEREQGSLSSVSKYL